MESKMNRREYRPEKKDPHKRRIYEQDYDDLREEDRRKLAKQNKKQRKLEEREKVKLIY